MPDQSISGNDNRFALVCLFEIKMKTDRGSLSSSSDFAHRKNRIDYSYIITQHT